MEWQLLKLFRFAMRTHACHRIQRYNVISDCLDGCTVIHADISTYLSVTYLLDATAAIQPAQVSPECVEHS